MARNIFQEKLMDSQEALTPGSDFSLGFRDDFINWGRHGNDTLLSFKPANPPQDGVRQNVDILIGDLVDEVLFPDSFSEDELITPFFWNDTFFLGDANQPYYVDLRRINTFGLKDFAILYDFDPSRDTIQLHGSADNYIQQKFTLGTTELTAIFWQEPSQSTRRPQTKFDLVTLVQGNFDLDLNADYFQYEGNTPASPTEPENILQFGEEGIDVGIGIEADSFGNVYVAGASDSELVPSGGNGSYDVTVTKLDSSGNEIWTKQFGTVVGDLAWGISTDEEGNFYLSGSTTGNLGGANQGQQDIWIGKFDGDGNQIWLNQFGGEFVDASHAVDVDELGNVYQSGIRVSESPEGVSFPVTDNFFVTKYDANGNRQWLTDVGTEPFPGNAAFDESYDVAVGSDDSVYASGWTLSNLEQTYVPGGDGPAGLYDTWVSKFDNNGNLLWINQFGTNAYEFTFDIELDSQDNVYAAGWTLGNLGGQNAGSYDAWIAKFDPDGNQEWVKQLGTAQDDGLFLGGLTIDGNDEIFLTGYTNGNLGGQNAGSYDPWVTKFDPDGNQAWTQQFGSSVLDYPTDVSSDSNGNLYVSGYTEGSLGAENAGALDTWVAKLNTSNGNLQDFNPSSSEGTSITNTPNSSSKSFTTTTTTSEGEDVVLEDLISTTQLNALTIGINETIVDTVELIIPEDDPMRRTIGTPDLGDIESILVPGGGI